MNTSDYKGKFFTVVSHNNVVCIFPHVDGKCGTALARKAHQCAIRCNLVNRLSHHHLSVNLYSHKDEHRLKSLLDALEGKRMTRTFWASNGR